jgi:integrase
MMIAMGKTDSNLWDVIDLAEYLKVSPGWIYRRLKSIPHISLGKHRRFNPDSKSYRTWLASQAMNEYDSAQSERDEPIQEDQTMARTSYQKGSIRKRKRSYGVVFELRYRVRNGSGWAEKAEELKNAKGEYCRTEKEAQKARDKRMVEINRINNGCRPDLTFQAFVESTWVEYQKRMKESSALIYNSILKHHILPVIGMKLLREITPADITELLKRSRQTRLTGGSLMSIYEAIRLMCEVAVQYDFIDHSPVRAKIHRPELTKRQKVALAAPDLVRVIESATGEGRVMLLCLALTGIRVGEMCALRRRSIDFENATMTISETVWRRKPQTPKTGSSYRTLRIPEPLLTELKSHYDNARWVGDDDFLFSHIDGRPYCYEKLKSDVLMPALKRAGIERVPYVHGFHIFRHSAATLLAALTNSLEAGQKLLGHASESMTAIYTHDQTPVESGRLLAQHLMNCGLHVVQRNDGIQ